MVYFENVVVVFCIVLYLYVLEEKSRAKEKTTLEVPDLKNEKTSNANNSKESTAAAAN